MIVRCLGLLKCNKTVYFIITFAALTYYIGRQTWGVVEMLPEDINSKISDLHDIYGRPQAPVRVRGHCSLEASLLKDHQKVLSYCLYGNFSYYASGLSSILATAESLYPEWTVRLYTEPDLYTAQLGPLLQQHANLFVCDVANLPGTRRDIRNVDPTFWRIAALADEQVDVLLVRDIDSQILPREIAAVEEFLASGQSLHIMRDNPYHEVAILAGMYGVRQTEANRKTLDNIREKLFEKGTIKMNNPYPYGFDQDILERYLYQKLASSSLVHDSYHCTKYSPRGKPFPTQREGKYFVGNKMLLDKITVDEVGLPCPTPCRPQNHTDWEYC